MRRHRDRLWAVALRTLGDREEAADAVQDALVLARYPGRRGDAAFRGESAVTTWLHRIVVNACLDRVRRRQPAADPLPDYDVPDRRRRPAGRARARRSTWTPPWRTLPAEQRAALVLVDMYGYPVDEAAARSSTARRHREEPLRAGPGAACAAAAARPDGTPIGDRPPAGVPPGARPTRGPAEGGDPHR